MKEQQNIKVKYECIYKKNDLRIGEGNFSKDWKVGKFKNWLTDAPKFRNNHEDLHR